jgi:alpha-tubulin suppressor-like RCC1 family protein
VVAWGSQYTVPASVTNVVAIAAGWEHSLALTADGRVLAWGDNSYGQCTVPGRVTNATAVQAGFGHSMARLSDGTIVAWGKTNFGTTTVPAGLGNVASFSCGEDHELAMVEYGLPQISLEAQTTVAHVGGGGLLKADLGGTYPLACQWYHNSSPVVGATNFWLNFTNVGLTDAGSYSLVASNSFGQVSSSPIVFNVDPSPYFLAPLTVQPSSLAGSSLSFPINAVGAQPLACQWQLNGGNLTDASGVSGSESPDLLFSPAAISDSGPLTLVVTNSFGSYTGFVAGLSVTPVMGWGDDSSGQLQVPASVTNIVSPASGGDHNLALLGDGTLAAWGDNSYNQNAVPAGANPAVAIAEGDSHSLALKADGTVVAWGDNTFGQTTVPSSLQNAVAIAAGTGFSQALLTDGSITQWGVSNYIPSSFTNVMLLATKGTHSVALRADGTVVETGLQTVQIPASCTNIIGLTAGWTDSLALRADGSLVAWGKSPFGQTNVPPSATDIVAIAAGDRHFVALRADGVVIAWGDTNFSQTQVPALTQSIGLIQAGSVHSLAVLGQPFQRTAAAGDSITFSAGQFGNRLANFQWQFNGSNINGATNSTLTLGNICWTNSGTYRAVIRNTLGSITSPQMSLSVPQSSLLFDLSSLSYWTTNSALQMRLTGASGVYPVVVYASTNLADWAPVFTNSPTTNDIDFVDLPLDAGPNRFYRAVEQP